MARLRWTRRPFLDDGRLICFRGSRMLPPSYERIHVIFQVGQACVLRFFEATYQRLDEWPQICSKIYTQSKMKGNVPG